MMKGFKTEDVLPLDAVKSKIWEMFDVLRTEQNVTSEFDYHLVLLLLSVYKDNLISIDIVNKNHPSKMRLIEQLRIADNELSNQYNPIIHNFEPSLQRLSENGLQQLLNLLVEINKQVLTDNFPDIFDSVLYRISQSQGRYSGEFIQPVELTRLMFGLADLKKEAKIFNPFAGLASFGVYLDQGQAYFGQELNQKTWAMGALRLLAHESPGSSRYVCDDSILHWPHESDKFDLVISNPPYAWSLKEYKIAIDPHIRTAEQFLLEKGVRSLNEKGKLIALLPQGILFRGLHEQRLREFLVDEDLIDAIISLPGGLLLNTGIPLIILVLNRNKKLPGRVKFVDAKDFVIPKGPREKVLNDYSLNSFIHSDKADDNVVKIVYNEQIRDNDYNLSVARYFQKQIDGVKLGEILKLIKGKRGILPEKGKLIRIPNLKDDKVDFTLNASSIEVTELKQPFIQPVSESCLLLAMRWRTLKPTLFEFNGEPIFKSQDIMSFQIDESRVDKAYLINELHADYVTEQIESNRIGAVFPYIRIDELLDIKIKLPSLENQKAKLQGALEFLAEEKKKELVLFKKIHGLETEIVEQNTYLRHSLAGPTSNLKSSLENIKNILTDKVQNIIPDIMSLKVSDRHELTFGKYLEIIERDINKISDAISKQLKVETDIENKPLEYIDIVEFLNKMKKEYSDKTDLNFTIEIDTHEEALLDDNGEMTKVYILGNKSLLTDLFDNLISNAVTHAFSNKKSENRIEILLIKHTDDAFKNEISILVSNTGKPLPNGFKHNLFIRKGLKAGDNAGNGFGGWYINEIIKKMDGSFEIIDERGTEGMGKTDLVTSFEINFPILEIDADEKV